MVPTEQQQQATPSQAGMSTKGKEYRVIFPNTHQYHPPPTQQLQQQQQQPQQVPASAYLGSGLRTPHLIPPHSDIARAVMGNATSELEGVTRGVQSSNQPPKLQPSASAYHHKHKQQQQNQRMHPQQQQPPLPKSNLSALLEDQQPRNARVGASQTTATGDSQPCTCSSAGSGSNTQSPSSSKQDEADSASGPPPPPTQMGHSAPAIITSQVLPRRFTGPVIGTPPTALFDNKQCPLHHSVGPRTQTPLLQSTEGDGSVRRCLSSKELGTIAPPSGSPYVDMLSQREELENAMTERLREKRDSLVALEATPSTSPVPDKAPIHNQHRSSSSNDVSTTSSTSQQSGNRNKKTGGSKNEIRQRRRAAHNRAVVEDLCDIVADLFIAESKLINPTKYGFSRSPERSHVLKSVQKFVSALPTRYALGADTPSEVLLHMRLMAVARSDPSKCVVHFVNLDNDSYWTDNGVQHKGQKNVRLVTVACSDAVGLLEYITKLLGTGGSRVLDADVMLSSDRIVLDRFVVEMNGRLRLDKLAQLIEAFLKKAKDKAEHDREHQDDCSCQEGSQGATSLSASGPLYFNPKHQSTNNIARPDIRDEIQAAVPLTDFLTSPATSEIVPDKQFETLKRHFSMPNELACRSLRAQQSPSTNKILTPNLNSSSHRSQPTSGASDPASVPAVEIHLQPRPDNQSYDAINDPTSNGLTLEPSGGQSMRQRRPLVNRQGSHNLDRIGMEGESVDFVTVPSQDNEGNHQEARFIPLIPFDELMLIETIGMGRVSTIYRAVWQSPMGVQMVALKVAMVNPETGDKTHVDELRREADIAARLEHTGVCSLVGVAADAECFCLAYDFCEGGSVLSLLSDTSRYYEYLPIALDVANAMAYLHSRNVIHRDLKPSNVLLTRDHRAKIADFGMSVANAGQELTAETGTYRYMAPEVIRHESYSSNADVYSFGVFLWQLITRQVPFASMTPVQAAYAVAEGRRPAIPESTPQRLKDIIEACWDRDSHKRPSFTYIAMALADYAKLSFSPASVGAQTLQIANDMLATVEGNSNINVDFTAPVPDPMYLNHGSEVGLEIE